MILTVGWRWQKESVNWIKDQKKLSKMRNGRESCKKKNEQTLTNLWDNFKKYNIYIIGDTDKENCETAGIKSTWKYDSQKLLTFDEKHRIVNPRN